MYAYEQHDDQHHLDAPVPTVVRGDSAVGIGQARQAARDFTARLTPAPDPDMAHTLVLVVSELVTNALRHGGGTFSLRLNAHPDAIEVAVEDTSPRLPRIHTPDLTGAGGGTVSVGPGRAGDASLAGR